MSGEFQANLHHSHIFLFCCNGSVIAYDLCERQPLNIQWFFHLVVLSDVFLIT